MRRIKLTLEYDGTPFHGWQVQENPNLPTVQEALETALRHLSGMAVPVQAAGRTDAGVHAEMQVCHFDTSAEHLKLINFKDGTNRFLPPTVRVIEAAHVADTFQARFDCCARHYRYTLFNRREASPFWLNRAAHIRSPLNTAAMAKAAAHFLGEHDFSTFRSPICQAKSPLTTLTAFNITQEGALVHVHISGHKFLHNMVRLLCGTLVEVGKGKRTAQEVPALLAAKDRSQATLMLPAHGLCLYQVDYPTHTVYERV